LEECNDFEHADKYLSGLRWAPFDGLLSTPGHASARAYRHIRAAGTYISYVAYIADTNGNSGALRCHTDGAS
jgi:hypothetical protein